MEVNKRKLIYHLNEIFANDGAACAHFWVSPLRLRPIFLSHMLNDSFDIVQCSADDDIIDMDRILGYLSDRILDPLYTGEIGRRFEDILPLILTHNVNYEAKQDDEFVFRHRRKCVALAKLLLFSPHAQKFALTYFGKMPAPFSGDQSISSFRRKVPKTAVNSDPTELDILKCCYTFLKLDATFFMRQWKWSDLFEKCGDIGKQSNEFKLFYNYIRATIAGMSHAQLEQLNANIPVEDRINFLLEPSEKCPPQLEHIETGDNLKWDMKNELFTNIEGVLLPKFNASSSAHDNRIVMVESARANLRSIAIGVAASKAVCLSGTVGSGKTTLIEYLAYRTGRLSSKQFQNGEGEMKENVSIANSKSRKSNKRKAVELADNVKVAESKAPHNGFLRIQLGDQTDSKMLLGQYQCTDVPGEFVWQPGVLTQAVTNGYWLLLEDLDQCSRDVCVMLTNFFENNYLSVPGFRDCIQISSGFQLFVTRR